LQLYDDEWYPLGQPRPQVLKLLPQFGWQ